MDTSSFLQHILPKQGFKFIAIKEGQDKPWIHKPTESFSIAADIAQQADANEKAVYHACASFKAAYVETGETYDNGRPKRKYRIEDNAGWVKSFWLDLDCGDGKDYPNQREALADVVRFCKETGLPRPLLVNSGNGVHCYWVLEQEISAQQWKRIANILRSVADHFKIKHDAVCTTDVCRILRPVGTHNRKREAKLVKLIGAVPALLSATEFASSLVQLAEDHSINVKNPAAPARPSFLQGVNVSNDLSAGTEYPPSSAEKMAQSCAQVRDYRDAQGNVDEPLWYAMLGLLKHTIEGEKVCHEWSQGHAGYDEDATNEKIIQWKHGPTLCERLRVLNPTACAGCPHAEKIKSPIQLGVVLPENVSIADENEETGEVEELPQIPESMRKKYAWDGKALYACLDSDGTEEMGVFSVKYLYPIGYHDTLESKMEYTWVLRERAGKYRKFQIKGSDLYNGGKDLAKVLGDQGVAPDGGPWGKKAMANYITDWWTELRKSTDASNMYTTFGWHDDEFVLGDTVFRPDGTEGKAHVVGSAANYVSCFEPTGDLEKWKEGIDKLYNRPEHAQFQWMFGVGFGAPLVKLMGGNIAGCTINAYSPETAQGKSTAGKLAISLYGNPDRLALTHQAATPKATFGYIGLMNSLPVLVDEVTNSTPRELSDMLYQFSQGAGRLGANSDGTLRKAVHGWSTLLALTANRSAMNAVANHSINAESEMARVFEYKFSTSPYQMSTLEANQVVPDLLANTGLAGRVFISYIVRNRDKVSRLIEVVRGKLIKEAGITQAERFWLHGSVAIYCGLYIAKKLGLVNFDLDALWNWAISQIQKMRGTVKLTKTDPIEQFGRLLGDLHGRILTTTTEGDARSGIRATIIREPSSSAPVAGRFMQDTSIMWLGVFAFKEWCDKNRADSAAIMAALEDAGIAHRGEVVKSLGKGLPNYPLTRQRCFVLNLAKADENLVSVSEAHNQLRAVG